MARVIRTLIYESASEAAIQNHLFHTKAPNLVHTVGEGVTLLVVTERETPALPVEMPEPMPGMIVEDDVGTRCSITVCSRSSDGQHIIHLLMYNKVRAGLHTVDLPWDHPSTVRVYSAAGVLLWQRLAPASEEK